MQFFVKIAEFSRKFALKNSEKAYGVGVRFSLEIRKRVWKWFETPRRLYSVEVPGKRQGASLESRIKKAKCFRKNAFCNCKKWKKCVFAAMKIGKIACVARVARVACVPCVVCVACVVVSVLCSCFFQSSVFWVEFAVDRFV